MNPIQLKPFVWPNFSSCIALIGGHSAEDAQTSDVFVSAEDNGEQPAPSAETDLSDEAPLSSVMDSSTESHQPTVEEKAKYYWYKAALTLSR